MFHFPKLTKCNFQKLHESWTSVPLDKMLVKVLKTFEIYPHQLTSEAIIKVGVFIWAMRRQGLEPDARCFCNIHELSYQTKATGKEQYHNNFGCYSFVPRAEANYLVPTFQKKWPGSWMQEWFYVKVDLSQREDIQGLFSALYGLASALGGWSLHLETMCKRARQLSIQCVLTSAQETWSMSILLIECGHLQEDGRCRRRLPLAPAKMVWSI
jgi:hypothetical protein